MACGALSVPTPMAGFVENKLAATAMAMLAFQGDGHTHNDAGPYQKAMRKARDALLKFQERDGRFQGDGVPQHHSLYTHAQCTIVFCELYGMTDDSSLREPAQKAVDYCTQSQGPQGGWRYDPGRESDTSVTGWFVMALQSGRMAKLNVPEETLKKVTTFLDSVATHDGYYYGYMPGTQHSPSMTAEALLVPPVSRLGSQRSAVDCRRRLSESASGQLERPQRLLLVLRHAGGAPHGR